jgi:hypothetical protein
MIRDVYHRYQIRNLFWTKILDPGVKKAPDPGSGFATLKWTLTDGWAGEDGSLPGEGEAGNVAGVVGELGEQVAVGNVPDEDPQVTRSARQETPVRREGRAQDGRPGKLSNYPSWIDLVGKLTRLCSSQVGKKLNNVFFKYNRGEN